MTSCLSLPRCSMLSSVLWVAACGGHFDAIAETAAGSGGSAAAGGGGSKGSAGGTGASTSTGTQSSATARAGAGASSGGRSGGNNPSGDTQSGDNDADAGTGSGSSNTDDATTGSLSFFVSSEKNKTGNLGGLDGADERCQTLAEAVAEGARTWRAYLSADNDGSPVHARDRIGRGPWFNAKGKLLAQDVASLHDMVGDADLFLDERGNKINGQWQGSGMPVEHDVLTGSTAEGMLMPGMTCQDWTSESNDDAAQVGHSDGLGPMQNDQPPYSSWNSAHANGGCADTAPRGGAGRIYCFAADAER